jgi:hypothetical protein
MTTMDEGPDRRGAKLSALLKATDPPARALAFPGERVARARRRRTLVRRLGATILVLLAGAALVPPVRAWIVGTARHLWPLAPDRHAQAPRNPDFAAPANRVSFATAGDLFVVNVATRQAAGALRFERSPDVAVHAALTGDPAEAVLVVLPGGLRIVNGMRVKQDYVVRLPAAITRVQVRIGDEAPLTVPRDAGGRAIVPLASETAAAARSTQ